MNQVVVVALYRFVPLEDYAELREPFHDQMQRAGVRGTLLLAREGINGTVAGDRTGVDQLLAYLRSDPRLEALDSKESLCDAMPFRRARVRLKKEIVTMGVDGIDPLQAVGTYVDPQHWNELISDPDVVLIDTRNDYEFAIGAFKGATSPETRTFRQFPEFVEQHLDPGSHPKIAMYCTGGIRCEKSTAFLKQRGFKEVYHLRGGILKYLQEVDELDSLWEGECFVFDGRVSVGHGLRKGDHVMCFGCGWPVTCEQQTRPEYVPGVQCPHCAPTITEDQRKRFAERQRQHDQQQSNVNEGGCEGP